MIGFIAENYPFDNSHTNDYHNKNVDKIWDI